MGIVATGNHHFLKNHIRTKPDPFLEHRLGDFFFNELLFFVWSLELPPKTKTHSPENQWGWKMKFPFEMVPFFGDEFVSFRWYPP